MTGSLGAWNWRTIPGQRFGPLGRWALRVGLGYGGRGRNRANLGMVPAWGRSSSNKGMGCSSNLSRTTLGSIRGIGGSRGYNSGGGGSGGGGDSCHSRVIRNQLNLYPRVPTAVAELL